MYQYELTITQKSEVALGDLFQAPFASSVETALHSVVQEVFENTLEIEIFNFTVRDVSDFQTVVRFEAEKLVTYVCETPIVDDLKSVFLLDGGSNDFAFELTATNLFDANQYTAQALQIAWEQEKAKNDYLTAANAKLQEDLLAALSQNATRFT